MFRQEEVFLGGWKEKTVEAMQRRRFEQMVSQLPPLGSCRLEALSPAAFERRIERCWQDVRRKPMRAQQVGAVWKSVLSSIDRQADCLAEEEHALVERALILGGSARIEDAAELEAAYALSLRLWASVGLVSGKPYVELETPVLQPVASAFARTEHDEVRRRLQAFSANLGGMLYRVGAMDDRQPQQMILREVFSDDSESELLIHLARRYLWAGFDCVDYAGGVMLVHSALADPSHLLASCRRRSKWVSMPAEGINASLDILPEEIPLQQELECSIAGALRDGYHAQDVARSVRFLCKQGAPLDAMKEVLQEALIVCVSPCMYGALTDMYLRMPKWIECTEHSALH